jgi:hypothetical protein
MQPFFINSSFFKRMPTAIDKGYFIMPRWDLLYKSTKFKTV